MSIYPKVPRPIIAKLDREAAKLVVQACDKSVADYEVALAQGYSRQAPGGITLYEVFQALWGYEHSYYQIGYAVELCQWELGQRNRRPSSQGLSKAFAAQSYAERFQKLCDDAHRVFGHWLALHDEALRRGLQPGPGRYGYGQGLFGSFAPDVLRALNAETSKDGQIHSPGGEAVSKRPKEERPELAAQFDEELAEQIADACQEQLTRPVALTSARTVEDCLYFPIRDVVSHLATPVNADYGVERLKWLTGAKPRRPDWGTHDDREQMRALDALLTRLARHWLSLQQALSPTGSVDVDDADSLLFDERLLLTDVSKLCTLSDWQEKREIQQVIREASRRGRLSPLGA